MSFIELDYDWELLSKHNILGTKVTGRYYINKNTGKKSEVFDYATAQIPKDGVSVTMVRLPKEEDLRLRSNSGKLSPMYKDVIRATYPRLFGYEILNSIYQVNNGNERKFIPAGLDSLVELESNLAAQTLLAYSKSLIDLRKILNLASKFDRDSLEVIATLTDKNLVKAMIQEAKHKTVKAGDELLDKNTANFVEPQVELIKEAAKVAPVCASLLRTTEPSRRSNKKQVKDTTTVSPNEPGFGG